MFRKLLLRFAIETLCLIICAITILMLSGCEKKSAITIGAILPMTGGGAQYGEDARRGINIAIEEINANGGISGKMLNLKLEDSGTDPKIADLSFKKLTTSDEIQVILTEVSGVVLALAPEANKKQVILFNIGAQSPKIREAGPFVFSNINDANVESKQIAKFCYNNLGLKKAAILYSDAAYGEGARQVFDSQFKDLGGKIVSEASFTEDALDYRAQILEIKKASPGAVFLPGLTKDMAKILKQAFEVGYKPQWLSYTAFEGEDIIRIAGKAAEGVIYSHQSLSLKNASKRATEFAGKFKNKHGVEPGIYSATSYDAIIMTADAMKAVGNNGNKIRDYFHAMPTFDGAAGSTKFLLNGAVEKAIVFKTVRDGKFVEY